MSNLLIINRVQFGYHTDVYKWCEYLRWNYNISVITFDSGKEKCQLNQVNVEYVSSNGFRPIRGIRYIITTIWKLLFFHGLVIVCYFPGCEIIKYIIPWKKIILDIRTLDVSKDVNTRLTEDKKVLRACKFYDYITIISKGLQGKMNLAESKSAILPLGADNIDTKQKSFDTEFNLLYIGTFNNRNIDTSIKGFVKAANKLAGRITMHYDIIGDGSNGELQQYNELVKSLHADRLITLHGYIQHEKLNLFLEKANIGVSYVPIKDYYEYQPVTKTFEYGLAGLFTIATATSANKEVISPINGLLIDDDENSFCTGIINLYHIRHNINYDEIKKSMKEYEWKNIIEKRMLPLLHSIEHKFYNMEK